MISDKHLVEVVKKYPVSVGCGALAVILGLALYFRGGKLSEAQIAYEAKTAEGEAILANISNGANLDEQLRTLVGAVTEVEGRLVRINELAKNLQYFYRIEADTAVKILDLRQLGASQPKAGGSKPLYGEITYVLSVQGSFADILAFLARLETGPHFYRLNSLNCLQAPQATGRELVLNLNLSLLGFPS